MAHELPVEQRTLSPTDISQYLRLDRCERFLRFRLYERAHGRQFLYDFDVAPQEIPPILTRSGSEFEKGLMGRLRAAFPLHDFSESPILVAGKRAADNERLAETARRLAPGRVLLVCQPRLDARLGAWRLRGDADLLRLERDAGGALSVLVTDMKSSARAKVEHRLQVAFYQAMLEWLFQEAGVPVAAIRTAVLYRGPADEQASADAEERDRLEQERAAAADVFGLPDAYLEVVADPDAYRAEVTALVTAPHSAAERVAALPFDDLFYALGLKCDGCLYNEFCMKDSYEHGDLSLVPYLTARDKKALRGVGLRAVPDLARLKEFTGDGTELAPMPETERTVRLLATTSAGPRLDELVLRARATRTVRRDLDLPTLSYIPSKGHTTLPYSDAGHNPNLVHIYIDAQHDFVQDRVGLIGALIVANENGVPARRRHVVHLSDGPPDSAEKEAALFAAWIRETLTAVVELAAPDANGERKSPLHLIFWNDYGQRTLLDALARNMSPMVAAAPALYDFVTQMAAFDSPVATFLEEEIRERKNYPMLCQSLQSVASYLKFDWGEDAATGEALRQLFRQDLFDKGGKAEVALADGTTATLPYERRSRHGSQIPLEYVYAAWDALEPPTPGQDDNFARYRGITRRQLIDLEERRLDAVAWIADQFEGNRLTEKTAFTLPELASFSDRAEHLAQALKEFVTVERHVFLAGWRAARQLPPERRALLGETLLVRYVEEDQTEGVAERNRENARRRILQDQYRSAWRELNPDKRQVRLPADQKAESDWSMAGMPFRLRVEATGVDADLDTLLGMLNVKEGERFILFPRWTTDERLPEAERTPFTPTPKQMLYGMRAELTRLHLLRDEEGRAVEAFAHMTVSERRNGTAGYVFSQIDRPLEPGELYTLDPDPNDFYGMWQAKVCDALCDREDAGTPERHILYHRIAARDLTTPTDWPAEAAEAQARFLEGLDAFHAAGLLHDFEPGKREYIGGRGGDPVLLVQGPPGTGKSYSTAFAALARMQGALAAGLPQRIFLSCKTHSATDVLLTGVAEAVEELARLRAQRPDIWAWHFDHRLLALPLLRIAGRGGLPDVVQNVTKAEANPAGEVLAYAHCFVGATPGGIYSLVKGGKTLFGHDLCDLLILDEASQMSLPEAMMAALPLAPGGRLIVVGDPRQMPPIVHHAWETEPRRTFKAYRSYESLFDALVALDPPYLRFEESFRLHAAMARFLRDEVYIHDGIEYHSHRTKGLEPRAYDDPFVGAVLDSAFPLVVVVHAEEGSQTRNAFEEALVGPVLRALADPEGHGLNARDGLGVVVPHRAQRVALRQAFPELCVLDEDTGEVLIEAVDTVERYQGDEREVILVSATESDPEYLQGSAGFLLDPRRLTVALSRAKRKMILIASRTIFAYFSGDEEMFRRSQLWKNLLRRACTTLLWQGEREGKLVEVWGRPASEP